MTFAQRQRGFTLIEVVLSIAIAGGVAAAVFSAHQLMNLVRVRHESAGLVTWEGDLVLHRLETFLSRGVVVPALQDEGGLLELSDGTVIREQDGRLIAIDGAEVEYVSSARVRMSSLSFDRTGGDNHDILRVGYTLSSRASDSQSLYTQSYHTSFYAR
jgi:prepilin-type N-terminal cleavage/methylation domain-containing protein